MNRHLIGLLSFALIVGGSFATVRYFSPAEPDPKHNPPPPLDPPPPPDPPRPSSEDMRLTAEIDVASLDVDRKRADARLMLEWASTEKPPERIWVWAWFFKAGATQALSGDPIEVRDPFRSSRKVAVTIQIPCPWVKAADFKSPVSLYTQVNASARSKDAARIPLGADALSTAGATAVVVQAPAKK